MKEENLVQGALDRITGRKPIESKPAPTSQKEWMVAWRELAELTSGLTKDDPRLVRVMRWLDIATTAEIMDYWQGFEEAAEELKRIMRGGS